MWTVAKVLIALSLPSLAVALVRFSMPVEVTGVLDLRSGRLLWERHQIDQPARFAVGGDLVFAVDKGGALLALQLADGRLLLVNDGVTLGELLVGP